MCLSFYFNILDFEFWFLFYDVNEFFLFLEFKDVKKKYLS